MIDISIKMPPAPTPPKHGGVDPLSSIPRSHRIDEGEGDSEHEAPRQRKQKHQPPEQTPHQNGSSEDETQPHIDNYA